MVMTARRPDVETPTGLPLQKEPAGPTGEAATALLLGGLITVSLVIVPLVLLGGWSGLAIAVTLMIAGLFVLTRYVQKVAWTGGSPRNLRRGLAGMGDDLAVTDDARDQLSPNDVPLDSPRRRELLHPLDEADVGASHGGRPASASHH